MSISLSSSASVSVLHFNLVLGMPAGTNGNKLGRNVVMVVPDIFFYDFHFIQKINIDAKPIMNLIG